MGCAPSRSSRELPAPALFGAVFLLASGLATPATPSPLGVEYEVELGVLGKIDTIGIGEITFGDRPELMVGGGRLIAVEDELEPAPGGELLHFWLTAIEGGVLFPSLVGAGGNGGDHDRASSGGGNPYGRKGKSHGYKGHGGHGYGGKTKIGPLVSMRLDGLHWGEVKGLPAAVELLDLALTFGPASVGILDRVTSVEITGSGSGPEDPVRLSILVPSELFEDNRLGSATDLHLTLGVAHVPEPQTALLLGLGCLLLTWGRCARSR